MKLSGDADWHIIAPGNGGTLLCHAEGPSEGSTSERPEEKFVCGWCLRAEFCNAAGESPYVRSYRAEEWHIERGGSAGTPVCGVNPFLAVARAADEEIPKNLCSACLAVNHI